MSGESSSPSTPERVASCDSDSSCDLDYIPKSTLFASNAAEVRKQYSSTDVFQPSVTSTQASEDIRPSVDDRLLRRHLDEAIRQSLGDTNSAKIESTSPLSTTCIEKDSPGRRRNQLAEKDDASKLKKQSMKATRGVTFDAANSPSSAKDVVAAANPDRLESVVCAQEVKSTRNDRLSKRSPRSGCDDLTNKPVEQPNRQTKTRKRNNKGSPADDNSNFAPEKDSDMRISPPTVRPQVERLSDSFQIKRKWTPPRPETDITPLRNHISPSLASNRPRLRVGLGRNSRGFCSPRVL